MKLSTLALSSFVPGRPLHAWPDPIKRILLTFMVIMVLVAYMVLAGSIIAFLVVLAQWINYQNLGQISDNLLISSLIYAAFG